MQVAFQRFLDRNWDGVAAIYEDKHRLWGCAFGGRLVRRDIPARRAKVTCNLFSWTYQGPSTIMHSPKSKIDASIQAEKAILEDTIKILIRQEDSFQGLLLGWREDR